MLLKADKNKARQKRHLRVRNHIAGTTARPRLNVYRSLANIYAQVIDDEKGVTVVSASTQDKGVETYGGNIEAAALVGKRIAEKAKAAGVEKVAFDRSGFQYHGRVKALAEAARENGLSF